MDIERVFLTINIIVKTRLRNKMEVDFLKDTWLSILRRKLTIC
jgi:hypothetical protein